MRKPHLSNDQIITLLQDAVSADLTEQERAAQREHFNGCARCAARYRQYERIVGALSQAAIWDQRPLPDIPDAATLARLSNLVRQLHDESAGIPEVLDTTLTGSPDTWKAKLARLGNIHTYAMVRALVARSEATFATNTAGAMTTAAIAVEIADALRVDAYPFDLVINARAHAWFEYAFLLSYRGRFPEALPAIDQSEALFRQMPLMEFELARVKLVRASIFRSIDRIAEAISLTNEAAATFEFYGDEERLTKARSTQATMLIQLGRVAEALPLCQSIEQNAALQATAEYGFLLHNIGICYRGIARYDEAEAYLSHAIVELQKHNISAEKIRTEWSRAATLLAQGRLQDALPIFRQAWADFANAGLDTDAALVALDLAEALLANNQPEEVPAICRKLLDHFNRNSMMSRAVTALAFLREALAMGKATPAHVRHVADFIRQLPKQPALTYTPLQL